MNNRLVFGAMALAGLTFGVVKPDPFVGTWVLNVAKSTYTPGPAPQSATAIYSAVPGGLKLVATTQLPDGKSTRTEFTAKLNGRDYPVTGNPDYDMTALKRVGTHRIEFTRKRAGNVVQNGNMVVSADGKIRTVTTDGTNAKGEKVHNVAVYDRK